MKRQTWLQWLRECTKDPHSLTRLAPRSLGALTGQDTRALEAISACWQLYAGSDEAGQAAALRAARALLPALQPQCHRFAFELIAFALDWPDRERLWKLVGGDDKGRG